MFSGLISTPEIRLKTERLVVRLALPKDNKLLTRYYIDNESFLKPWEPSRDKSYHNATIWHHRLIALTQMYRQKTAFYFLLLPQDEKEVIGIANLSQIIYSPFYAAYLGYSLSENWQGQGLMFEALNNIIGYIFDKYSLHRIMANYMPHNNRSGKLLARLGFMEEGYAKNYLLINGKWQDHILTSLINNNWHNDHP